MWTGTDPDKREACEFKASVRECLYEYFDSKDKQEAARILRELELSPDQVGEEGCRKRDPWCCIITLRAEETSMVTMMIDVSSVSPECHTV